MLHRLRSSSTLWVAFAAALVAAAGPTAANGYEPPMWFQYVVAFTCGQNTGEAFRVVRGEFATSVNLLNVSGGKAVIRKNLALTYPPDAEAAGEVSDRIEDALADGTALQVDCEEIRDEFSFPNPPPATEHVQGFLVIESNRGLQVQAVYTATGSDGNASVDVNQVTGRRFRPHRFVQPDKVTVCHVPPGNPGNAHTIVIDAAAQSAHLAHGDTLGACNGG